MVFNRFAIAFKIPTEVLSLLDRAESFLVELFQSMFDVVLSTVPAEKIQKEIKNEKFWNPPVNYSVENLNKPDKMWRQHATRPQTGF